MRVSSKSAILRQVAMIMATNIINVYGVFFIFMEFLAGDPPPTRGFCRNMAKIVQL